MPQGKRKSISYKSFVTCEDPKGVVECGIIRKSKISPQKREQFKLIEGDKKQGNPNLNLNLNPNPNPNPSLAVIKEEKKEMGIEGNMRELETPSSFQLLKVSKGADKLNHVINSWSNSHHQKDIAKDLLRGALDLQESLVMLTKIQQASSYMSSGLSRKKKREVEEERFDRFGCQSPRLSVDGCSRKSSNELKNVVRDNLLRQNVITNPIFEENFDHRYLGSPDMPSTSTSRSSDIHSSNFAPGDSSTSSMASQKKGKCSNLIFKLMGLESVPSSPRKHREGEKILNLPKPTYDMDSPRARKPQFGTKQRSVDEILETLNFKGLLRTPDTPPHSEVFAWKNCCIDDRPPIVIMKPLCFPCLDLDESFMPKFQGNGTMGISEIRTKTRSRRGNSQNCEEKGKSMKEVVSSKPKASVNLQKRPQKKEVVVEKVSEVMKVTTIRKKGEEKKAMKSIDELRSRDQAKLITTKTKKQKDGVLITKNSTSNRRKITSTSTSILDRNCSLKEPNGQKPVLIGENQRHKTHSKKSEASYRKEVDSITENEYVLPLVDSTTVRNLPSEEQAEVTQIQITGHLDVNQSPLNEVTLITTHENGIGVHINTVNQGTTGQTKDFQPSLSEISSTDYQTLRESRTPREKLKALILSSPSFLIRVDELFNLQVNPDFVSCLSDESDQASASASARVIVDCANEFMELIRSQISTLPSIYTTISRNSISLDRLLEEICCGIENLGCYVSPVSDSFSSDNLYLILDHDLKFKNGTWEIGWKNMFSQEEVEQVISEVDKLVLGKLIEEFVADFML